MILESIAYGATTATAVVAIVFFFRLRRVLGEARPPRYTTELALESDLPSVTVCIPARNEQHALIDCLERVLASTYQKLEIIVFDDVSGDDTSALIKSFASSGVRFVKGEALPQGWLGKNHALQGLLEEASGSYLLYMDVDTRLEPHAIEYMVRYALSHNLMMLSVLPRREDGWRVSVFFSPLRFFWNTLFHTPQTPAVYANAWLIRRTWLTQQNGFHTYALAMQPDQYFARDLSPKGLYRFLVSTQSFGVGYEKKWRSQLLSSVRYTFPSVGYSLIGSVVRALEILILLVPWIVLVWASILQLWPLVLLSALVSIGYSGLYGYYTSRVWRRGRVLGALLWPLLLLQDSIISIVSAYAYKRKRVSWKGRPIQPVERN